MSDSQRYPDNVLFQRIEQIYAPAAGWKRCQMPMTTAELITAVQNNLPGYFDDEELILRIFDELGYEHARNEYNNKFYWLLNPAGLDDVVYGAISMPDF